MKCPIITKCTHRKGTLVKKELIGQSVLFRQSAVLDFLVFFSAKCTLSVIFISGGKCLFSAKHTFRVKCTLSAKCTSWV